MPESSSPAPKRARRPARPRRRDTPPPSTGAGEKEVLVGFLDYLRESIAAKVEGAPEPEVRTPGVPSGTQLLGLLQHVTYVERFTFLGERVTSWPATFRVAPERSVEEVVTSYREAVAEANLVIASCDDLSEATRRPTTRGRAPSLRWALAHMIEETGRHAGHADILRELVDGSTGR